MKKKAKKASKTKSISTVTSTVTKSNFEKKLLKSAKEAIQYVRGKKGLKTRKVKLKKKQ